MLPRHCGAEVSVFFRPEQCKLQVKPSRSEANNHTFLRIGAVTCKISPLILYISICVNYCNNTHLPRRLFPLKLHH